MARIQNRYNSSVVSPRIFELILTSPRLADAVMPGGADSSPYEVLDYDATLTLDDVWGRVATFRRQQRVRFLQDGVAAIMDHAWGAGIILTSYHHSAGAIEDSFRDEGKRHLVIGLKRAMKRGEELQFRVERRAMESFTTENGVLETTIDHPIRRLSRAVIFPKHRPVQMASYDDGTMQARLPIFNRPDGRTMVGFALSTPRPNTIYTIRWRW